jgi:hypothetical protein
MLVGIHDKWNSPHTDDSDDDSIVETISNGIYLTKLLRIPLDELEARMAAKEALQKQWHHLLIKLPT